MTDRRRASSRPLETVIRYHSPYCEVTGPIVQEGTVKARIQALQNAQRGSEETVRSVPSTSPLPPTRLTSYWRPSSPLDRHDSVVSGSLELQRAHTQLAHYVSNNLPDLQEEVIHGVVHNRSLIFGTPRSRKKSYSAPGDRSHTPYASAEKSADTPTVPELEESHAVAVPLPGLTRQSSTGKSIRQNSGSVRARKSVYNITPGSNPLTEDHYNLDTIPQEPWTEKRPLLRKTTAQRSSELSKQSRPNRSIAEQITEMIDRALEGRSDSMGHSTPETSVQGCSGNRDDQVRKGKFTFADLPNYLEGFMDSRSDISPGAQYATKHPDPHSSHLRHQEVPPHRNGSIRSRRLDGRYSHTEETIYPASSTDIPSQQEPKSSAEIPGSQTKQRACTYSHRYPPKHLKENNEATLETKVLRMRSISSPPNPGPGKSLGNDQYEIYVRQEHEKDEKIHNCGDSFVVSDRSRKHSLRSQRTHASKARRASVNHSERSSNQGSKRWRWWKLVLVDKEESPAGVEADSRDERSWRSRSHPLANNEDEDEGYETSDLVEALERAVKEQREASTRPIFHEKQASAFSTHTLAECGHEDGDDEAEEEPEQLAKPEKATTNLAVDGSSDNDHQKAVLTVPTDSNVEATASNTLVNVSAENHGAIVEVRAGETRVQDVDGVSNNFKGVKVIVTVEQGSDSAVVKVEIRPRRR